MPRPFRRAPTPRTRHGPSPAADENVLSPRGTVHEVPGAQPSLFAFDQEQALPGEHEEVLLGFLSVVQRARLAGTQYPHAEADLLEARVLGLEDGVEAATVSVEPRHLASVDDKPALSGRTYAGLHPLEWRLRNHRLQRNRRIAINRHRVGTDM